MVYKVPDTSFTVLDICIKIDFMPFNSKTVMEQKQEFVLLASSNQISFSELCRRYNVSRVTGYKWLNRSGEHGELGMPELSRKPHNSPLQTPLGIEQRIVALRLENPAWGAKKLYKLLEIERSKGLFSAVVPARSTINSILKRYGLISEDKTRQAKPYQRFEYEYPNELWQMDFKGDFALLNSKRCYPLTITDDHSRFNIGLFACGDEQYDTVKNLLITAFEKYGKPDTILTDNGSPWGVAGQHAEEGHKVFSTFEKWLITHRIRLIHGRAYHPQTQGKEERFHRTLKDELLSRQQYKDLPHCQSNFDLWREKYNCYRPHEAIDFEVPANRYKPSLRTYENVVTEPQYQSFDVTRKVDDGWLSFKGKPFKLGRAFSGDRVAIRPTSTDGIYEVYFYDQIVRKLSFL
jgi:transposase InsO family protein